MVQTAVNMKSISGIFDEQAAQSLLYELEGFHIQAQDVSVLMSENTGNSLIKMRSSNKAPEGASIGGLSGGVIGAIVGSLTLAGSVIAPGVGLLMAGPVVGLLAGTAAGVGAGGILGALIGLGVPEHEAKYYQDTLKDDGNMLIVVRVSDEALPQIKGLFERFHGKNIHVT